MNSVWSKSLSLKYSRCKPSGCKDRGIKKFEYVAKNQVPLLNISAHFYLIASKTAKEGKDKIYKKNCIIPRIMIPLSGLESDPCPSSSSLSSVLSSLSSSSYSAFLSSLYPFPPPRTSNCVKEKKKYNFIIISSPPSGFLVPLS